MMTTNDGGYYFSRREEEERSFDPRDFIRDVMHLSNNSFPDDDYSSSNWKDEKRRVARRRRGGRYDTVTQNTIDEERNRLFEKKRQIADHDDNAHRERTSLFNKGRSVEAKFGFETNNNEYFKKM